MKKKLISGIMVTVFLVTMLTVAFPVRVSASAGPPVVIGLIGPKGWIQWDGIKEGAELARDLINNAPANDKGMWDGSQYRPVQLVEIDEHAVPVPDPTAAVTELLTALDNNPTMKIVLGGFRTEVVLPMREAAMDYAAVHDRPIWVICGAATDELIDDGPAKDNPYDDVREDYDRYKYMFRITPMNSTNLITQLLNMVGSFIIPKLKGAFGISLTTGLLPVYIVAENLVWCDAMVLALQARASALKYEVKGVARPSAIETEYGPILDAVESSGAKLIFHIFSAVAGASFIKQWGEKKTPAMPVGINVESQMQEFYASVGGLCQYETFLASLGTRNNLNPDAKPLSTVGFWDTYSARTGHAPIYTAWGVYGEIIALNETAPTTQWMDKTGSQIVSLMETMDPAPGLLGRAVTTTYHDIYADTFANTPIWPPNGWPAVTTGKPNARAHIPQWQAGKMEVIWPRGYAPAPGSLAPLALQNPTPLPFATKYKIAPFVYSLAETDFAGPVLWPSPPIAVGTTPAGFFGYFALPDGSVGVADMTAVTGMWQQTCVWTLLEADMDGNQYIDIDDVARVALDWGKTA